MFFWVAFCAATALGADQPSVVTPSRETRDLFQRFAATLEILQKNYLDPSKLSGDAPTTAALRTFVRSLDPNADLLAPDEALAAKVVPFEDVGDPGIILMAGDDYPTILSVRDGSPGQSAGLLAGDRIIAVDGTPTLHARLVTVSQKLSGPAGSTVALRLFDPVTDKTRDLAVRRAPKAPVTVKLKFLNDGISYCRLAEFTVPTVERLHSELQRAKLQKARGLILDLRGNAGGAFDAALVAARLFVPATAEIVSLDYSDPKFRTSFVSDSSEKFAVTLVLLVNAGTAVEAEIFAAALRDHKRAQLVGTKTAGRGVLIAQFPLPDGWALSIPTARYLPPSGQLFNGVGITPDVEVLLPRDTERSLATAGFGSFDWVNDKREVLKADLTLAKALELLAK